jgi:methylamine dehydrogenase heavy chain
MGYPMRSPLASLTLAGFLAGSPAVAQDEIQPETVGNLTIPAGTEMVFSVDIALGHVVDGRMHVLDAKDLRYIGLIGTSNLGMVHVPPGTTDIYVATTHLSRTTRGTRTDLVEIYSGEDLTFKEEIPISTNRAQALNYRSLFWSSSDLRYLFIQNATPATSVSVVDLTEKKEIAEIPNPGCYGIFPAAGKPLRFATTCGDGTFGTIDVVADGSAEMKASAPIFDPDADAIFSSAVRWDDKWVFASYAGNIYIIDVEGDVAALADKIPLSEGVEGNWRPGGYQPIAVHGGSGMAYVLMHSNGAEGSHKNPAEEIWAVDLKAKTVVGRAASVPAIAVTASQGETPALFAVDGLKAEIVRYDLPATGASFALTPLATASGGELPDQVEVR